MESIYNSRIKTNPEFLKSYIKADVEFRNNVKNKINR
jgi:hypothetical protein